MLRVLIAEDNPVDRDLLHFALEGQAFDVTMAHDGVQALDLYRRQRFDLVLLDLDMPALDGTDAARAMRQWDRDHASARTPILAITAHVTQRDRENSVHAGMDDVIAKPFTLAHLHEMMLRWSAR